MLVCCDWVMREMTEILTLPGNFRQEEEFGGGQDAALFLIKAVSFRSRPGNWLGQAM